MKTQFVLKEFRNPSGAVVYRVYGRKNDGQVVRQNFKLYARALARKQELEIESINSPLVLTMQPTRLTVEQVRDAEAAFLRLKDNGHSLVECVEHFLRTWKPALNERKLADALAEFLAIKKSENLRQLSVDNLRVRIERLVQAHKGKLVSQITKEDIRAVKKPDWSPVTWSNERRALHCFFAWALDQGYCAENPASKVKPPKIEQGEPQVLTLPESVAFLRAARDNMDGLLVPFVCLSLYSGLRPTELKRISWSEIDLENKTLTVKGAAAKLRQRRLVELSDNLIEWLLPHRGHPIFEKNFRRDFDRVRRLAGYRGSHFKKGDEKLKEWPNDLFRHTSLSFHLAKHKDEGETADWGGTSV